MKMFRYAMALVLILAASASYAAEMPVKASAVINVAKDKAAIVAELFTSQSCPSCPAAQAFLGDLSKRTDVIALEEHVDYWDGHKPLAAPPWKDPFSGHVWTQRQAQYNRYIMGNDNIFAPQMIIDGKMQEMGSRRNAINTMIEQAKTLRRGHFSVTPQIAPDGHAKVTVEGPGQSKPVRVVLALLERSTQTKVTAGENKGYTLPGHNVVREMIVIGTWDGGREDYRVSVPPLNDGQTCAVILQNPENMHILAGGMCGL